MTPANWERGADVRPEGSTLGVRPVALVQQPIAPWPMRLAQLRRPGGLLKTTGDL